MRFQTRFFHGLEPPGSWRIGDPFTTLDKSLLQFDQTQCFYLKLHFALCTLHFTYSVFNKNPFDSKAFRQCSSFSFTCFFVWLLITCHSQIDKEHTWISSIMLSIIKVKGLKEDAWCHPISTWNLDISLKKFSHSLYTFHTCPVFLMHFLIMCGKLTISALYSLLVLKSLKLVTAICNPHWWSSEKHGVILFT